MSCNPLTRPMRRKDRALPQEQALDILAQAPYGTLCVTADDAWPYATPLSHILMAGKLYFHCAKEGLRQDILLKNPQVCFSAVTENTPVLHKAHFTTKFASAVVFGKASMVTDEDERYRALLAISEKYLPEHMDKADEYIRQSAKVTAVWRIDIDHIQGKSNIR